MSRPAIVFLHPFGGSSRTWDAIVALICDEACCLTPDLRGFGAASRHPGPFAVADMADDIVALTADLGDHLLVGHSMGGKVALAIAARRPPGLRGLVLLAPSPPTPEPIDDDARARMLAGWGDRDAMASLVDRVASRAILPRLREGYVGDLLATSYAAWTAWLRSGSREHLALSGIGALPTLVVSGGDDDAIPTDVVEREVVARLPGARLVGMPGVGHLLPLEAADECAALIAEFALWAELARPNLTTEGERR